MSETSSELSCETHRRKPVAGGTTICSRCDQERLPGSAYCRVHKNQYQRDWFKARTAELHALRQQKPA